MNFFLLQLPADGGLPEIIERDIFLISNRFLNNHYRKTIRNVYFKLKHNPTVIKEELDSSLTVKELVQMCSP